MALRPPLFDVPTQHLPWPAHRSLTARRSPSVHTRISHTHSPTPTAPFHGSALWVWHRLISTVPTRARAFLRTRARMPVLHPGPRHLSGWAQTHRTRTHPRTHISRTPARPPPFAAARRALNWHARTPSHARTHSEPCVGHGGSCTPDPHPHPGSGPRLPGATATCRWFVPPVSGRTCLFCLHSRPPHGNPRHPRPSPHQRPPGAAAAGV